MERQRNWPDDCWQFDFEVPMSLSDRYDPVISIAGSVALDANGQQRAPGDLMAQTDMVAREVRLTVEGAGAGADSIAKLVVFYVGQGQDICDEMLTRLRFGLPGMEDAVITAVPVSNLAFPGMMIEVEGYAFAEGDRALARQAPAAGVLTTGNMAFVGGNAAAATGGRGSGEPGRLVPGRAAERPGRGRSQTHRRCAPECLLRVGWRSSRS